MRNTDLRGKNRISNFIAVSALCWKTRFVPGEIKDYVMEKHRELLRRLPATEYLHAVHSFGRGNLSDDICNSACLLYDVSETVGSSHIGDKRLRNAFSLINDIFLSDDYLQKAEKPRYIHYTNMRLLDRYLLANTSRPLQERHNRARRALSIIMRDWYDFELDRLSYFDANRAPPKNVLGYTYLGANGDEDSVVHLRERVRTLSVLSEIAAIGNLSETRIVNSDMSNYASDWEYFSDDADRELSHFLCLPRSTWHDEVMFLRMIHATECCFAGILASLETLPALALQNNWLGAIAALKAATYFSDFLLQHWKVFETMPVPHFFDGFREDTGDASAIQSKRFQTLDMLVRDLGSVKRAALMHHPEGQIIGDWRPPLFATLPGMIVAAQKVGSVGQEFIQVAHDIDHDLFTWRTKHFGVATRYLPKDAKGTGNEGTSYLKATYAQPRLRQNIDDQVKAPVSATKAPNFAYFRRTSTMALVPEKCPRFAAFRLKPIAASLVQAYVTKTRSQLMTDILTRQTYIDENLSRYGEYFGARKYPVARQYEEFVKKGRFPEQLVPALLLSLELRSGVLMGIHRVQSKRTITFDVATDGETFVGIGNKDIRCSPHEPVIRDAKGIIASVYQGPDKRTMVDFDNVPDNYELLLVVMGYPLMPTLQFDNAIDDCRSFILAVGNPMIEEWQS
jgi:tryptophan 2,3-dioxygenase